MREKLIIDTLNKNSYYDLQFTMHVKYFNINKIADDQKEANTSNKFWRNEKLLKRYYIAKLRQQKLQIINGKISKSELTFPLKNG